MAFHSFLIQTRLIGLFCGDSLQPNELLDGLAQAVQQKLKRNVGLIQTLLVRAISAMRQRLLSQQHPL